MSLDECQAQFGIGLKSMMEENADKDFLYNIDEEGGSHSEKDNFQEFDEDFIDDVPIKLSNNAAQDDSESTKINSIDASRCFLKDKNQQDQVLVEYIFRAGNGMTRCLVEGIGSDNGFLNSDDGCYVS